MESTSRTRMTSPSRTPLLRQPKRHPAQGFGGVRDGRPIRRTGLGIGGIGRSRLHAAQMALGAGPGKKQATSLAETCRRNKLRRHQEWSDKRQDVMVMFTGTVPSEVRSAAKRVAGSAAKFDVVVRGRPERRDDLPTGHPSIEGLEHVNPAIITIMLDGSMTQVVKLLKSHMPMGTVVVPIPRERCNVW